jgi:AmiR/NasT family two-component response regulator
MHVVDERDPQAVRPRRIVVTGERCRYGDELSAALACLGNRVLPKELHPGSTATELDEVGSELVVVVAGADRAPALRLIGAIRHEAQRPVVAAIELGDDEWTVGAVAAGASAALIGWSLESLRASVHAACERFAELRNLEQAFERRAVIERAKGVLMASHGIGGDDAFTLLRDQSRRTNRKLVEIADSVLKSHVLLGRQRRPSPKRSLDAAARLASVWPGELVSPPGGSSNQGPPGPGKRKASTAPAARAVHVSGAAANRSDGR